MSHISKFFPAFCLAAALSIVTAAAQNNVVDWGGSFVEKTTNLVLPSATASDGIMTYPYSDSAPVTAVTNYVVASGRTSPIFAALQVESGDGTAREFNKALLRDRSEGDDIYLQTESGVTGTNRVRGLFFSQKQDFLGGAGSAPLALDGLRGEVNITAMQRGTVRFAVRNGDSWYVSEASAGAPGLFVAENLGSQAWGAWNPAGAPLAGAPAKFETSGASLKDVSAFGFYFDAERSGSAVSFAFDKFGLGSR